MDMRVPYGQRELCDLWCRMIIRHSLLGLDGLKEGHDVLKDHPEDLPPQFHEWLEIGRGPTTLDQLKDQAIRSEVYLAMQKVFERYDLIVTPTVACLPVDNADDGNTVGPSAINGEAVNPLIGWCLTYLTNFTGNPAASVPAGSPEQLPIGMQIIGRRHSDADVLAASAEFERRDRGSATFAFAGIDRRKNPVKYLMGWQLGLHSRTNDRSCVGFRMPAFARASMQ